MVLRHMTPIFLSHLLDETTPAYGNGPSLTRDQDKLIDRGDSCNTEVWHLPNHLGTHVDAPRHFSREGVTLDQYSAEFWCCAPAWCLEMDGVLPGQILSLAGQEMGPIPEETELLLIKTGFGRYRGQAAYMTEGPGIDPGLADRLRDRLPRLKMIGLDIISLSSFTARDLGRKAHRAFLDHERPILIVEDMDLSQLKGGMAVPQVWVSPVRIRHSDAAPCTVTALI
jgi:arylformamidase